MSRRRYLYTQGGAPLPAPVEVSAEWKQPDAGPSCTSEEEIYGHGVATDGTDISTKRRHADYMKRNGLAMISDFTQHWETKAKERARVMSGDADTPARKAAIGRALYEATPETQMSEVREDIQKAMEALSTPGEAAPEAPAPVVAAAPAAVEPAAAPAAAVASPEAAAPTIRDDKGRFTPGKPALAPAAAKPAANAKPPPGAPAAPPESKASTPAPAAGGAPEALRAPSSWKPAAREVFAKAPREVQEEALRVDKEVRAVMQEAAPAKREAEAWRQAIGPYEAQLRSMGNSPQQAVQSLLQTAAALEDPRRAPAVIAHLVRSSGVAIEALANALDGQPEPQQGGAELRDPRFDAFLGQLQTVAQQKEQTRVARAHQDIAAFADTAEFFNDVREDVGLHLAAAAKRNQSMSLQEAYDRACWASSDIRAILQRRSEANAAKAKTASTQQALNAASSVRTQPAGGTTDSAPTSLRAQIEAAMATVGGRR